MSNRYFYVFVLLLVAKLSLAQFATERIVPAYIKDGDTIYMNDLNEVEIVAPIIFENKRNAKRYSRLIHYVKKVYPYARIAGVKMREYEEELAQTKRKRDRRKLMRKAEQEMKEQFSDDLKRLTYMQGEILLKLIDRETNVSSYEIVKDMRGGFKAVFYQASAQLFGFDLKERYDPQGRDKEIEEIVLMIEAGKI